MKRISFNLFLAICVHFLILGNAAYAGKVQDSESYLKKFDPSLDIISKNLDDLKVILDSNNNIGSFLTTSFWGPAPSWYILPGSITLEYPFARHLTELYEPWDVNSGYAVRSINDVIFSPKGQPFERSREERQAERRRRADGASKNRVTEFQTNNWSITIAPRVSFFSGANNLSNFTSLIKRKLASAGIPKNKQENAWEYFEEKFESLGRKIEQKVYSKFDTLPSGNTKEGQIKPYQIVAQKLHERGQLNEDDYLIPMNQSKIFTQETFQQAKKNLLINSLSGYAQMGSNYRKVSPRVFYMQTPDSYWTIRADVQYFNVAAHMSKSEQYNQLKSLKAMLEKKVASGAAQKIEKDNYVVYRDAEGNGIYRGELGINFTNGEGYWQLPVIAAGKQAKEIEKSLTVEAQKINNIMKDYQQLCLKETIVKFVEKNGKSNDF